MRRLGIVLTAGLTLMTGLSSAVAQGGDPIGARRALMAANETALRKFSAVAKGQSPLDAEVIQLAAQLHENASRVTGFFPAGSEGGKSRAKPEVWTDWARFEALARRLESQSVAVLQAAQSGDLRGFASAVEQLGATCGACHGTFRK